VLRRIEHGARHGREHGDHSQPRQTVAASCLSKLTSGSPAGCLRSRATVSSACAGSQTGLAEPRPQLVQGAMPGSHEAAVAACLLPLACDAWHEASSIPEWLVGKAGPVRRVSGRGGSYRRSRCFRPLVARPPSLLRVQCCTKPPEAELRVPVRRWSRCLLDSLGSQLTR